MSDPRDRDPSASPADLPRRRPGAFSIEDIGDARKPRELPPAEPAIGRTPRAVQDLALVAMEPDDAIEREGERAGLGSAPPAGRPRPGFPFGKLFVAALGALVSIGIGLAVDQLIRDLFARAEWLGWVGLGLGGLLAIGALGVAVREALGLMRLAAVDRERQAALKAYESDSETEAKAVVATLVAFVASRPETAEGRARLVSLEDEIIDGRDRIALAERELLAPLDAEARALVLNAAKRVSVVTAVSPKALVDVAFVLFETVRLIRRMSELYGARPGTIGLVKLTRDVLGHLAVTGTISIGDSVIGQVVGHGIAAKLSARLGEGVVNGLLTARVGLAAMDLCRPLPFLRAKRPKIADFVSDLARLQGVAAKPQPGFASRPSETS